MRSHAGWVLSAGEYHRALKDSRIRDLEKGPMTAQEMGIQGKYVRLLNTKGYIKRFGKLPNSAVKIWASGPNFKKLLKNWDRWV
jgi:hypothetical protein